MRFIILAFGTLMLALISACGGDARSDPNRSEVVGHASGYFPTETLEDWKSYGDHVAVVLVARERALPPTEEELRIGEGLLGRDLTIQVERRIWSAAGAPVLPSEFRYGGSGWVLKNGTKYPLRIEGSPRLEVGERFIAPLVLMDDRTPHTWAPLGSDAPLPLAEDRIIAPDPEGRLTSPLLERFGGKSVSELAEALKREDADPLAKKYDHLRPLKRVQAVSAAGGFND